MVGPITIYQRQYLVFCTSVACLARATVSNILKLKKNFAFILKIKIPLEI